MMQGALSTTTINGFNQSRVYRWIYIIIWLDKNQKPHFSSRVLVMGITKSKRALYSLRILRFLFRCENLLKQLGMVEISYLNAIVPEG